MITEHHVIDNFLDKEYFTEIHDIITGESELGKHFPWFFQKQINYLIDKDEDYSFYLTHQLYNSVFYNKFKLFVDKLKSKKIIRVKANCYPHTHKIEEHKKHIDFDFPHKGCILSINTCDGATILEDGTKIKSVANRALFFDPSKYHGSTSTTNAKARFNINVNYE
jgi:hypothetical protein